MAPFCLIFALLLQTSFTYADLNKDDGDTREILKHKPEVEDNMLKGNAKDDWMSMFVNPTNGLYPTTSATLMAHACNPDKPSEEQLKDIKDMAHKITEAIQSEMANLLSYAIANCEKDEKHGAKHKRSVESPLASSQLVMRLLKHIKANNENQNIAIEKMMSAQEIADKYGINYTPDESVLADLAGQSSQQSEELSTILNNAFAPKVQEQVSFVPLTNSKKEKERAMENSTYYVYALHIPEEDIQTQLNSYPPYEYMPERLQFTPATPAHSPVHSHAHSHTHSFTHSPAQSPAHYGPSHPHQTYYNFPETQIQKPPTHHVPAVSPRPALYEPAFTPIQQYHPSCPPVEPVTTTTTIVLPCEEPVSSEPELVGQEYEETITNKIFVEKGEEPGSTDVNHVMTYSVSEKSHFKNPEIEKLPQQMQYCFFMIN